MIQVSSPAKLNLFLHVLGKRRDGYHNLQTVFQLIDCYDEMTFSLAKGPGIELDCNDSALSQDDNLVCQAAALLQRKSGCAQGASIVLHKRIPVGGGLGGGSSNAATTLLALNALWGLNYSRSALMDLGKTLGADVPVFVSGHSAWAQGIGEELWSLTLPERWYVIIVPGVQVSTAQLFQHSGLMRKFSKLMTKSDYYLGMGQNDFERILRDEYIEIDAACLWLSQFGKARITGTGACVYATFDSRAQAGKIASLASNQFEVRLVKGINHSPVQRQLLSQWGVAKR